MVGYDYGGVGGGVFGSLGLGGGDWVYGDFFGNFYGYFYNGRVLNLLVV